MLDLSKIHQEDSFILSGREPVLPSMTVQQAQRNARDLLSRGLPPSLDKALSLLSVGGVLTAEQMNIAPRTMRKHAHERVVDRLAYNSTVVANKFLEYRLTVPEDRQRATLYTLGPVGIEISKMRYEIEPPIGYIAYTLERIMHDVVVNELALRIGKLAMDDGWTPIWVGEQEAALTNENQQILKPDALVRLRKESRERLYLIEYHNEDKSTRAAGKVQTYERAYRSGLWRQAWDTDTFPVVLAVFRKPIVGRGYEEGLKERNRINCTYYGRLLGSALEDIDGPWLNIGTEEKEIVFPWAQAPS
jgi:hypothetical protein